MSDEGLDEDLMKVTEKLQFIDPTFRHLSSVFIRDDLIAATKVLLYVY